jgi:hypothetical protein
VEQIAEEMIFGGIRVVELGGQVAVMNVLVMCDPRISLDTETDFINFWRDSRKAISELLTIYPTARAPRYDEEDGPSEHFLLNL